MGQIKKLLEWLKTKNPVDIRDFHIYGGLILAGTGLFLYSPAFAYIVIGFLLFFLGILAGRIPK